VNKEGEEENGNMGGDIGFDAVWAGDNHKKNNDEDIAVELYEQEDTMNGWKSSNSWGLRLNVSLRT